MNHLQIAFEDSQHLRSQIGHLYDTLNPEPATEQAVPSLALYSTEEIKSELERRTFDIGNADPIQPEKAKPGRKAKPPPAPPAPAAANDPEPDKAALPDGPQEVDRDIGGAAPDLPSSEDMEALLARFFAVASLDTMRQIVFETTGAKTLKAAPRDTWPKLKARLEHELTVGAK